MFARKNYFYPDLPKGYQISQYEQPLATGGGLTIRSNGEAQFVSLTRIHMEEDAGKSLHEGFPDSDRKTYLDFNRSGVPLIEIVTEPDMRSADEAAAFFETLRQILVWLRRQRRQHGRGQPALRRQRVGAPRRRRPSSGTKAEVKNVNSFRYLEKAIEYEIGRQIDVVEHGGRVVQETRLFDAAQGTNLFDAQQGRGARLSLLSRARPAAAGGRPERRHARFARRAAGVAGGADGGDSSREYGVPEYDAALLTQTRGLADYFEATARARRAIRRRRATGSWARCCAS